MKHLTRKTVFWLCLLSGFGLLFIGIRFFTDPVSATFDYGIGNPTSNDYSFQHLKGARDFFFGLIIIVLLLRKQWQAIGWVLLLGAIIPAADFCIVATSRFYTAAHTWPHLIAVVICLGCGVYYLKNAKQLGL